MHRDLSLPSPSDAAQNAEGSRVVALDGLRGVAAAIVVFGHCLCVMERTASTFRIILRTPLALFIHGPGAVEVFFVLSGFVLAGSLSRSGGSYASLRFLVRRFFRLYPPYWFAIAFAWLASLSYVVPAPHEGFTRWIAQSAAVRPSLAALPSYFRWPGDAGGLIPVGWTLGVETFFSLLFPILLLVARRAHWLWLVAASGVAVSKADPDGATFYALGFSLGIALYCERDAIHFIFTTGSAARLFAWLGASLVLFLAPALFFPLVPKNGLLLFGSPRQDLVFMVFGAAGIVAATLGSPAVARAFAAKPIAFLGRISYSLYLLHFPVLILETRLISRPPTALDALLLPVGVFAVTLPLAAMSHRFVELPAIDLGARAARWIARSPSSSSSQRQGER